MVEKKPVQPELKASPKTTHTVGSPAETVAASGHIAGPATAGVFPGSLKDFDFSKLFSELKLPPAPDLESVLAINKRNLEAISEANRVALEGAQAVAKRHLEIVQSTIGELTDSVRSFSVTEAPASRAAKQTELLKQAYENAVSNTRELGDLIQKSNIEAIQKLNHRFSEALSELKTLFNKP